MQGVMCPKIKKLVDKLAELANTCYVYESGDGVFQVVDRGTDYIVDWHSKSCSCMRWQKSGVTCIHVIACCRNERVDPLTLVDQCYSVSMFKKAYSNIIYPCKDITEWEKMNGPEINPPDYQKHVGRPCKSRRKGPEGIICSNGGRRMSRHGVIMHCSYYGEPDHNIKGCKYMKAGLPPPNAQAPPPQHDDNLETSQANMEQQPPPEQANMEQQANTSAETSTVVEDLMVDHMLQQVI